MRSTTSSRFRPVPAGTDAAPLAFRRQLSAPALLRLSLDAIIAVGSLLAIASYFGEPFQGPYLILALIVFSLTFPGAVYNPRTLLGLARDVLLNWFIVLLILLFFGYASGYLSLFPANMVLAWSIVVPILVFTGHATIPYLLPKLLAIEGMRRVAVDRRRQRAGRKAGTADSWSAAARRPGGRGVRRPQHGAARRGRRRAYAGQALGAGRLRQVHATWT